MAERENSLLVEYSNSRTDNSRPASSASAACNSLRTERTAASCAMVAAGGQREESGCTDMVGSQLLTLAAGKRHSYQEQGSTRNESRSVAAGHIRWHREELGGELCFKRQCGVTPPAGECGRRLHARAFVFSRLGS